MPPLDSTRRFSDRVEAYVRFRPSYPAGVVTCLQTRFEVARDGRVADVGAGTGISTELFLAAGHPVVAVEPNAPMRQAAERRLAGHPRFRSVDGTAERTTLEPGSVDLIVAAQAFHWFDPEAVRREWRRILRGHGQVALLWNTRLVRGSVFLERYEALLQQFGTDYVQVSERYGDETQMRRWFGAGFRGVVHFENAQLLDFESLKGRLLSSSYAPRPDHPRHAPMMAALRTLFDETATDGHVRFAYDTVLYVGVP